MGMGPAQALAAAAAFMAAMCGFYAPVRQFVRMWKGEVRVPQSVKEVRNTFRLRIWSKNWTRFQVALVLAAIAAFTAFALFAPLAAMFVFPHDSALGRFLGFVSAFGVLLGVPSLFCWLREKLI